MTRAVAPVCTLEPRHVKESEGALAVRTSGFTRSLVAGALVLGSVMVATPAPAHVVEVTTAVEMPDSKDRAR